MDSSHLQAEQHTNNDNNNNNNNNQNNSNYLWLPFSLSNHHHLQPSLFQHPFSSHATTAPSEEQDRNLNGASVAHNVSLYHGVGGGGGGGGKLEDFLGGGSGAAESDSAHFKPAGLQADLYDSELKNIAASFLRGFSTGQTQDTHKRPAEKHLSEPPAKKPADTFGQRTSIYRGVTRHRWTGRYEAHLWDNSCRREGQSRKGRQVYLGGYDKEEKAARAYDLAALKYWGPTTTTNFPVSDYEKELEEMKNMTRQEFVASLRRKSSGFSRGASIYRGVTRHHQHGRWQARIGRVAGNKDLYLGTFSTQEEAAEAYDIAAIKFRGLNAVTNFDISRYDVKSIACSNLPVGGMNKSKTSSESDNKSTDSNHSDEKDPCTATSVTFASQQSAPITPTFGLGLPIKQDASNFWSVLGFNNTAKAPTGNAMNNLFQSATNTRGAQGITPFSMDLPTVLSVNEYYQEQSNGMTRIGLNSNSTGSTTTTSSAITAGFEGGNWILPTLHAPLESAGKPNLSAFQTPIVGME